MVLRTVAQAALLLWGGLPCSGTQVITREVTGRGATYGVAVADGLKEALRQIKGVDVSTVSRFESSLRQAVTQVDGIDDGQTVAREKVERKIRTASEGYVSSYSIAGEEKTEDGWVVRLLVHVPTLEGVYKPGPCRAMAVMPLRTVRTEFRVGENTLPAHETGRQLTQRILTELTQSRRFAVLDREYVEEFSREKNLIVSPDASSEELAKVGEVLGADYMLVGTLSAFGLEREEKWIPVTGERVSKLTGRLELDYRIIVTATRQAKWADSLAFFPSHEELRTWDADLRVDTLRYAFLDRAAKRLVNGFAENIYPIRVVEVREDGTLVLDRGGRSLAQGDALEICRTGEELFDSSGRSLGPDEEPIGRAEVTLVRPKFSHARLENGASAEVKTNDCCRRVSVVEQPAADRRVPRRKRGVKLPFD